MKRSELFFSAIQVPVDFVMIMLAAVSAYYLRNIPFVLEAIELKPLLSILPFSTFMKSAFVIAPFFILIYALEGMYIIRATRKFWQEGIKVFSATAIGLVAIIITVFLKREWFSSRFIILSGWMLAFLYVFIARYLIQRIQKWLLTEKGIGVHRVLLIGTEQKTRRMNQVIREKKHLGYEIVDKIEIASVSLIKEVRQQKGIDEIILCEPAITDAEQEKVIDYCAINNIAFKYVPTTLQTSKMEMGMINGDPIIEIKHTPLDGWGRIYKRIVDLIGSIFGIVIFSPIMILVAALIKLESILIEGDGGPIIYKNERVGNDGNKFFVYKFRYIKWKYCTGEGTPSPEESLRYEQELIKQRSIKRGPLYKIKDDPRKTKVGNIIEKLSIDELPQFFNVAFGSMSLVGPRPHQEREVEKYKEYHRRLLTIKPGITGMAQISGRSDLTFEDEYKLDLFYIENWSLWLDFLIMIKTVGVIFKRRRN